MRPLALALLALVLAGGALAACSAPPQPAPTATPVTITPSPTPTASPIITAPQSPTTTTTPAATPTPRVSPTLPPSPIATPNTIIPIAEGEWEKISFPGTRVDAILIDPADGSLQIIQLPWQGEKGQVWTTQDGDSLTYIGEKTTISEAVQIDAASEQRSYFHERIVPQLELNPGFLPPVTGKFQGGLAGMVKEGDTLFATIVDLSSNAEDPTIPAREGYRLVTSINGGETWVEIVPPVSLQLSYPPRLAIGQSKSSTLYLVSNEGVLWQSTLASPP